MLADYLIHLANVLYVGSYSVRDILWLRLLTVVALFALLPYYYTRPTPLYEAIAWNVLFLLINGYQLYRLLLERRPVRLDLEQQRLYELAFSSLTPRDFLRLVTVGTWEDVDPEVQIVEHGETLDRLSVIVTGEVRVEISGDVKTRLSDGQFVGEVSYVTGKPACAFVHTAKKTRIVCWQHDKLRTFLSAYPEIRASMQNVIGTDLASKLRSEEKLAAPMEPAPA